MPCSRLGLGIGGHLVDPPESAPFYRILATKYDPERETEALELLEQHPDVALLRWPGPDDRGTPFVRGSTVLHYAANDGKLRLMTRLITLDADVNASDAHWFRSVLSWAANNARLPAIALLLERGASARSLDALHAEAWGGSSAGRDARKDDVAAVRQLIDAGADPNDRRHSESRTPLGVALQSGNQRVVRYLRSIGAAEA